VFCLRVLRKALSNALEFDCSKKPGYAPGFFTVQQSPAGWVFGGIVSGAIGQCALRI